MGGGVNISHNSKMSQSAKNQMSFPGGMPGPGNYGSTNNNVVGKGMAQYMAGEAVGMKKYGKHKGPEKALVGKQENLPEALKDKIEAAPGMYGKKKSPKQMGKMEEAPISGGPTMRGPVPKAKKDDKKEGDMEEVVVTAKKLSGKERLQKGKDRVKAGREVKKTARKEIRSERKNARKAKRSARLDKKIALQEFKGNQKAKAGDQSGAKAKQNRVKNLKARKAKK